MIRLRIFIKILLLSVPLSLWSLPSWAFLCNSLGTTIDGNSTETANVYVNLQPSIGVGQNLVVDLSNSISCLNQDPSIYLDPVRLDPGSAYGGILNSFSGSVKYYGTSYAFPLTQSTSSVNHTWGTYQPWQTILYLTPLSTASGVVINAGDFIATIVLDKTATGATPGAIIYWNIYANNSVVVPTGGCDVSSRDVTVTLPTYPGSATAVPLTVYCAQNQNLAYYLSGTTYGSSGNIFTNTSSSSAATGVGVQLSNSSGVISANTNVSLGTVGTTPVSLGLTANYARTSGQVTAGNVQSVIGVTFLYQ